MTYQPHNPGYSGPQQPAGYGAPAVRPPAVRAEGPSKLPVYLTGAVVVLGLFAFLASFGPLFNINTSMGPFGGAELTASGMGYWTIAALIAGLLAAVGLVSKGRSYTPVVAVAAVLGLLLVIGQLINRPNGVSVGWALWLVLLLTLLQAGAAVVALLVESGVITAPAPRPRYDAYGPYGPPPAGYYGQPVAAPGPPPPGYPAPYQSGGYAPGGYGQPDNSPETPPTGFPSLGQQQPPVTQSPSAEPSGSNPS
ncbi:MAG: DUF5336 domain-containing protein [Mycobacteriaceae bacterium]